VGIGQDYKRGDLFLVRLWSTDNNDGGTADSDRDRVEWHGKVQRVVDGEAHLFTSLQDLTDRLLAMLADHNER
jgi:hypothetical protein